MKALMVLGVVGCVLVGSLVRADDIVPSDWAAQKTLWKVSGPKHAFVPAEGRPFGEALRLTVPVKSERPWDMQAQVLNSVAFGEGDRIRIAFEVRVVDGSEGKFAVWLKQNYPPHAQMLGCEANATNQWKSLVFEGVAKDDFDPGTAMVQFHLGYQAQTVEIGGLRVERTFRAPPRPESAATDWSLAAGYFGTLYEELRGIGPGRFVSGTNEQATFKNLSVVGTGSTLALTNQPFSLARRVVVPARTKDPWNANVAIRNTTRIRKGEVVYGTFWARGEQAAQFVGDAGGVAINADLKRNEPFVPVGRVTPAVTEKWQRFHLQGKAEQDYAPRQMEMIFSLGFQAQTVEIGGVALLAFPTNANTALLPKNVIELNYPGRAPDHPWRAEAARRIDAIRKADLTVTVTDAEGKPVPGAAVRARLRKHAFGFGTAIEISRIVGKGSESADSAKYREVLTNAFNKIVYENALKWPSIESRDKAANYARLLEASQWFRERGIRMRGHVLVWPSFHNSPKRLLDLKDNPEALRSEIRAHVTETATKMAGWLDEWDVINECNGNHEFMDILGQGEIVEWFKLTQAADPRAKRYVTETIMLKTEPRAVAERQRHLELIDFLVATNCPFDGIGGQGHFRVGSQTSPMDMLKDLDRMGRYGKEIQLTEIDCGINDTKDPEQLQWQADYLRDILTVGFSHPAMTSLLQWGFWEGQHWIPSAALWRKDWSIKPNGQAYLELVYKTWWTDDTSVADAAGAAKVRGFLGDYEVVVTAGGKTKTCDTVLPKEGQRVTIRLNP